MNKKAEFKKLIDKVLRNISKSGNVGKEISLSAVDMLHIMINLNQQIEEIREDIAKLAKQQKIQQREFDRKLNILINELISLGYIRVGEKRKLLKRTILTQEALTRLLVKKKLISKRELLDTIKKARESNQKYK